MLSRGVGGALETPHDQRHAALELQHEPGIENVLARRPPVHVARSVPVNRLDFPRQVTNERNGKVPIVGCFGRNRTAIVEVGLCRSTNRLHCRARHDAELRLDIGERGFDIEHRLEPRTVR